MATGNPSIISSGLGTGISPPPVITPGPVKDDFIKEGVDLTEKQRKYCRCLLKVESKGRAYSPYGVCTKSVGAQVHSCSDYYDWASMDLDMLLAYLTLHKVDISGVDSREKALEAIRKWKTSKGYSKW